MGYENDKTVFCVFKVDFELAGPWLASKGDNGGPCAKASSWEHF